MYAMGGVAKKKHYGMVVYMVLFLTTIETLDGFSKTVGSFLGGFDANTSGTYLLVKRFWKEQRYNEVFFQASKYSKYRPDLLG